jgi:23S rRNA (cytosine1962-C5)-methyltransferase
MATVILKPGRDKSLRRHHPWLFANAIAEVEGEPELGTTVDVLAQERSWLGRGAYSPHSQLRVRMWTFDSEETIDESFFHARLARAIGMRQALRLDSDAWRLVNGESDGLPGLIVDRYGEFLVCQFTAAGIEKWRKIIVKQLQELAPCAGIYERSDLDIREKEGLAPRTGLLAGREPSELIELREGPCRFLVDIRQGHKTGFYLDQRDNRAFLTKFCEQSEILNCFAYTGAFSIAALRAGALRVTNVESSAGALALGRRILARNGFDPLQTEDIEGNVFDVLRHHRQAGRRFDLIVLDPPRFIDARAQLMRASRGYKDINWLAFQLLRPGGILFTFSCSGLLEPALFQKIVADAALDAHVEAQIIARLSQASDHPVALSFPEGGYLKGLVCRL